MKREIKFRAWDKENKKMAQVSRINFGPGGIRYLVDDSVLLEYTGLHDKNGREIYEGDIVSFGSVWNNGANEDIDEEFHIGVVEYDPHYAVYNVNCEESGEHRFMFTDVVNYDGFGVIGNIFENQELLEGKQ